MKINLDKLIGEGTEFAIEHRIFNIILISGFLLSTWSAFTNYLLNLDVLLISACLISSVIMAGLYYLSVVWKKHSVSILALILLVSVITPVLWILNGGISGSIPFYVILFSSLGATVLSGFRRRALIIYFIATTSGLLVLEYYYPSIITTHSSVTERYIDIFISLTTTIVFNAVIIAIILKHYKQEHQRARTYLEGNLKAQKELLYLSYHDALTGLYNRMYFEKEAVEIEEETNYTLGFFMIDIDID